nr:hypothetical protein [Bacteriovoracaceae bacterium]
SHDIWKGTVEMYVGSTKVEEGTIVSEDANSLIYKILQLKEEGFEFVGLDNDMTKVEELRDTQPPLLR